MIYFVLMYYCTYLSAHAHHTSAHAILYSIIYLDSSKNITFPTIFNNYDFYVKNVSIILRFMKNARKKNMLILSSYYNHL